MSEIEAGNRTTILVCITCRPPAGALLADATTLAVGESADLCVQRVRCLGNCTRGLSAAIRHWNAWTYVFGDLDSERDAETLVVGARLLAQAADGLMPWRGRPEPLKRGLIARVPPLELMDDSTRPPPSLMEDLTRG